jgi:hypothetical protein
MNPSKRKGFTRRNCLTNCSSNSEHAKFSECYTGTKIVLSYLKRVIAKILKAELYPLSLLIGVHLVCTQTFLKAHRKTIRTPSSTFLLEILLCDHYQWSQYNQLQPEIISQIQHHTINYFKVDLLLQWLNVNLIHFYFVTTTNSIS